MRLKDTWQNKTWPKLALAFLINALFLFIILRFFTPVYETNDDMLMSRFVDGQHSVKTAYVPFINITLGFTLKLLYTCFGCDFPWYAFCQYLALYLGFTAITWVLLRRFRLFPALTLTAIILGSFAADCYLSMNFSKPSAVATVGGMAVMLCAMEQAEGRAKNHQLILGGLLSLLGYVWRFESFGVCALLMAAVCLPRLFEMLFKTADPFKSKIKAALNYLLPFILLAAAAVSLYAFNAWAWNRPEYRNYTKFDYTRSVLIDFEVPEYNEMQQVYDELGMNQDFVYLLKNWSFYDSELFTQDSMDRIIQARESVVGRKSAGECLGIFLDKCLASFFSYRCMAGFALILMLWLACGKRKTAGDWIGFGYLMGLFFVLYLLLIYLERYLANRVDMGFFLAMAVALCFFMDGVRLFNEKLLCAAAFALCLFSSYRSCREACLLDSHYNIEDKSIEKAAVERLMEDEDCLYFVKVWSMDHLLYTPLETPPQGFGDRFILIGGYTMHHPVTEAVLQSYGVSNPYRDLVNNDKLYIIDKDIERSLAHINGRYGLNAHAEELRELSEETYLKIYKIVA